MSKLALQRLLTSVLKEIKGSSDTYRKLVSDKMAHSVTINAEDIKKEVKKELSIRLYNEGELPMGLVSLVDTEVDRMAGWIYHQFDPEVFQATTKKGYWILGNRDGTQTNFTVVLAPSTEEGANVFNKIAEIKRLGQQRLVGELNKYIRGLNRSRVNKLDEINSAKFLDIGHSETSAVSRRRKAIVQDKLAVFSDRIKDTDTKAAAFLNDISNRLSLVIEKDPGLKSVISVSFESSYLNQLRGATTEKAFASITGSLTEDLRQVLQELRAQDWLDQKSSSSQLEIIEAEVLNPLADVNGKGIRNKIKKRKLKITPSKAKVSEKAPRVKRAPKVKTQGVKLLPMGEQQSVASLPLQLLVELNKRLPATVMKNMEYPALENRTGRFANSVKATNILTTAKGFPSIEYTYQLDPYQTFEPGGAMGSLERDPKRLIDRSIREIASEYAMMRFYTRRG